MARGDVGERHLQAKGVCVGGVWRGMGVAGMEGNNWV
jgi:hypothetical protein